MDLPFRKILICDDSPDFFLAELKSLGFKLDYRAKIVNEELKHLDDEYDAILIKSALILDQAFFKHFSKLKLVLRPGSGLDNVDLAYCKRENIEVINSPNGNSNAVGEHVLGLLLMMANNLYRAISQVREKQWIREENRGFELENKFIGVIGIGNAGSAFCKKLEGFNVNLLPHDKYKSQIESINRASYKLEELYSKAEVVSLHLPLNQETHYYGSDNFFNSFKKPIYFINASRGGVLDSKALLKAITNGKVIMAALDVLEVEPLKNGNEEQQALITELLETEKVLITPHIAGWTHEAKRKMFSILIDRFKAL